MNSRQDQLAARNLMAGKSSRRQSWVAGFCNLTAVVIVGLVVFSAANSLMAADVPAANVALSTKASTSATTNDFNVLDNKYRLAIGDQLSFRIIEDEDDPKELIITDSGDLQIPYIGRYPAVGKTCKELALALKVELERTYYRQATVNIAVDAKPRSRGKIYLVGAVRVPGAEDISSDEELTVSRAILRAGSFSDFADQKNVRVTRGVGSGVDGKKTFTVNVARVFEKGKTEDDLVLRPGDLIFVPERMIRF